VVADIVTDPDPPQVVGPGELDDSGWWGLVSQAGDPAQYAGLDLWVEATEPAHRCG
jgi:hypothetical protein